MNKFKSSNGRYYTRQLFWEESIEMANSAKAVEPMFTLYTDKEGLINFGKEYVESEDPTGYKVSQKLLDGYRMWTILMQAKWFQTAKKLWDEELDARLSSKGIEKLQEMLENGKPQQQAAAAKYFADKEFRKDKTRSKGRPSKAQIAEEVRKEALLSDKFSEDYKRIQLVK